MAQRVKYSDLILMLFVVAIAAMLIIPLPTPVLDILLVCNIAFAILLLLIGLYVANSGALYTFPTILLLSTLFRLGLNVASARLILSQGEAGRVIEAFGTFLIRGEVVVGLIIFSIVTVVNFIVISSGAGRVSEVAARFALDALPGKQMMIDNDARAGVISANEARLKRDELRRESQLYGSMDGAMKFVQGDAIAGLFIIAANIFGGMYMGILGGMGFSDAVQTYTVLTVGDGLVTQIPSLLTSICAGIIVTRVSSSERSSLSADLRAQLFEQPVTLFVTAFILFGMALVPGLPMLPFLVASVGVTTLGWWTLRHSHGRASFDGALSADQGESLVGSKEADSVEGRIVLSLDSKDLHRLYRQEIQGLSAKWRTFREKMLDDIGISLPPLQVQSDTLLASSAYKASYFGVELFAGDVPTNSILVEISSSQADALGLRVIREEEHPVTGHRVFWTENSPAVTRMLLAGSIGYYDFFDFITLRMCQFCVRHPEEFISVTYVHSLLRQIEKKYPGLMADGFGREFVSIPKLTEILQELVRQGVSIRDFRSIIEALAQYCAASGITTDSNTPVEVAEAVHFIRASRRRQIVRRFVGNIPVLPVITLSPRVERDFEDVQTDRWTTALAMPPEQYDGLFQGLHSLLRPAFSGGILPIALLCSKDVKEKVISFVRVTGLNLFVTTLDEVDPAFPVMQVGVWKMR
ncbi:MAG: hypothetical protein RL326_63 [Pseudomonadota bacterium]|jgi:type III secretion protein V